MCVNSVHHRRTVWLILLRLSAPHHKCTHNTHHIRSHHRTKHLICSFSHMYTYDQHLPPIELSCLCSLACTHTHTHARNNTHTHMKHALNNTHLMLTSIFLPSNRHISVLLNETLQQAVRLLRIAGRLVHTAQLRKCEQA